jgi:arsenite-transporting ATPase
VRVVLFAGKGGVGKTTTAAATAALAAARGRKTLVVSTDAAHSLADALGVDLGGEPTEVDGALSAMQVDVQRAFERAWRDVQGYLVALLDAGGIDPLEAEELTVLPGAEEILALLAVRDAVRSGAYDLVCVDCAPTAETLRLLRLPEALAWWMTRLYPAEKRLARSLRPLLGKMSPLPVPSDTVLDGVSRLHRELTDIRALLIDPVVTTIRLVLTPEQVVVAEARRTLTALALHGYRVDGVVANRVFPAGGDAWRSGWVAAQAVQLAEIRASFGGLPLWQAPYAPAEPLGVAALSAFAAEAYGDDDPAPPVSGPEPMSVSRTTDGFALHVALPLATKGDITLARRGEELVIGVGTHRRVLTLPSGLQRCNVDGARLVEGILVVRFVPNPELWMRPPTGAGE